MICSITFIQIIDRKWLDQLETLEGLREAVSLRSYGSKNPLTEYKIDGFNIFDKMCNDIRGIVMTRVFKARIQLSPEAAERRRQMLEAQSRQMNAQHSDMQAFGGAAGAGAGQVDNVTSRNATTTFNGDIARRQAASSAMQTHSQGANVTVRRTMPKVGRNDPCPCGSGKKYKMCCGR